MKIIKKIFLSGIIFLIILFLQVVFSEKNYAEKITEKYDKEQCKNDVYWEMKKITEKNRTAYYKNMKKIWVSLVKKSETLSYNFRVLSCNLEGICMWLQNFMFYWENWTKKRNFSWSILMTTWSCPELNFDYKAFKHCDTQSTNDFTDLVNFCKEKKDWILFWEKSEDWKQWEWWEYWRLINNFENDAKKDKVNFLAARIYSLNEKMRWLVKNMNRLKVEIVNIVNRIICTEKW